MTGVVAVGALPTEDRRLVRLMQDMGFGRIEALHVRDGKPVWEPRPRVVLVGKPGNPNGRRPGAPTDDFVLKQDVRDLLAYLESKCDGILLSVEVRHGCPFKWEFEEGAA